MRAYARIRNLMPAQDNKPTLWQLDLKYDEEAVWHSNRDGQHTSTNPDDLLKIVEQERYCLLSNEASNQKVF